MKRCLSVWATASLLGTPGIVLAQTQTPQVEDQEAGEVSAADIIVTATRRPERLQAVPLAVQAVDGDGLADRGIASTADIQYASPGVTFSQGVSSSSSGFSIRGVGTASFAAANEQSVGLSIDGVSQVFTGAGIGSFVDLDRVEVLRGPQGMLYGKNASAGLISVVSNAPSMTEISGMLRASYGSRAGTGADEAIVTGVINTPLSDKAAIRVAGQYRTFGGIAVNRTDGTNINALNDGFVRGRLRYQLSPAVRLDLYGDYSKRSGDCCQLALRAGSAANAIVASAVAVGIRPGPENFDVSITPGLALRNEQENVGGAGELNIDLDAFTLTALTAYRTYRYEINNDGDLTPSAGLLSELRGSSHQFTQELRIASSGASPFNYVAGLFYFRGAGFKDQILATSLRPPAPNRQTLNDFDLESGAVFGQAEYQIGKLSLIAGGRYTRDNVGQTDRQGLPGAVLVQTATGSVSAANFSYRAGVKFEFSRDLMLYGTVARGYKGPAYSSRTAAGVAIPVAVAAELSTSYELGVRTTLFDDRATFNITAFRQDFSDYQASNFDPETNTIFLRNAGGLRTQGLEAEASFRVSRALSLNGNLTYLDAKYTDFAGVQCATGFAAAFPAQCRGGVVDATGTRLTNAPELSLNVGASLRQGLGERLTFVADANGTYRSSVLFLPADPFSVQPGYGLIDLSAGIEGPDNRWEFRVFARNLLDQQFTTGVTPTFPFLGPAYQQSIAFEARRRVGASLEFKF